VHTLARVFLIKTEEKPNWIRGKCRHREGKYPSSDKSSQDFVGNALHTLGFTGLLLPIKLLASVMSFKEETMESDEKEKAVF